MQVAIVNRKRRICRQVVDRNALDINAVEKAKASNVNTTPIPVTSSSSKTLTDNLNRNVLDSNALEMAKASNVNTTPIPVTSSSSKTLSDNLNRSVLDSNALEMAKASTVNTTPILGTHNYNEDDMPLKSGSWKRLGRKKKPRSLVVHNKSYGKRAVSDSEGNQLNLPSKRLQVLKVDEAVPFKLAEVALQPRQEQ